MFKLVADFKPSGDQPEAIKALCSGLKTKKPYQTLQGVTGSGKTFTLANAISQFDRPVLVLSHNKTLAAQLYSEFKAFFPENAVEYFISYYDYYLPEAYIPQTDTYIAKDASINENIERLRLSATASLIERQDVIVVASVSCIYGLGSPEDYEKMCASVRVGSSMNRDDLLRQLISIQYERNDIAPEQGQFRVRGDCVDVFVPQKEEFIRVEFWGDEIESISRCDKITSAAREKLEKTILFPCRHFVMPEERIERATAKIKAEMKERVAWFEQNGMLVEAQRLYQRVTYDLEMLKEIGYCSGIENYSLHLSDRIPGSRPFCLLDFFPEDFITIIDESHVTIPQLNAMYKADRSRKSTLVEHGFRLPSALDNRPLKFDEFRAITNTTIFVSATPGDFELELSGKPVEQVVRPTGLLDPDISVRSLKGQIDDVIEEVRKCNENNERAIVTTLTKKSAERLSDYLTDLGIKSKYLHSEVDAIQRVIILSELRKGEFDCLIGINLLREGIDLPEVALVAILDADKEGFLRSERSLIQVSGRAARNANGRVILYADRETDSIKKLLKISKERRLKQDAYNKKYNIIPETIRKSIRETIGSSIAGVSSAIASTASNVDYCVSEGKSAYGEKPDDFEMLVQELENEMLEAASALEYERAAMLRDKIKQLTKEMKL
jgi:excinuclease ABC subunit B